MKELIRIIGLLLIASILTGLFMQSIIAGVIYFTVWIIGLYTLDNYLGENNA